VGEDTLQGWRNTVFNDQNLLLSSMEVKKIGLIPTGTEVAGLARCKVAILSLPEDGANHELRLNSAIPPPGAAAEVTF
jgi:hypothetical protein